MGKVQVGKPAPPFKGIAVVDGKLKGQYIETNYSDDR